MIRKTIAVTGATGLVGACLVETWLGSSRLRRAYDLVTVGRTTLQVAGGIIAPHVYCDLQNQGPSTGPGQIDALIHLAARRSPAGFADLVRLNVDSVARVIQWAIARGARQVVHVSSISVHHPLKDSRLKLNEDSPLIDLNGDAYGVSKRLGEGVFSQLCSCLDSSILLRPTQVYGPKQTASSPLASLSTAVETGDAVVGYPDGNVFRPIFVDDLVDVLFKSLEVYGPAVCCVGGPSIVTERAMLDSLGQHLRHRARIESDPAEETVSVACDNVRVNALFPNRKQTTWEEGLKHTWAGS